MPDNERLVYPAGRPWRGPASVLFNTAVSLFTAAFAVPGIASVVVGIASASAVPVFFGVFWSLGYGLIIWRYLRLASWLELSGGSLSWRCSLPWSPRMRPGRISAVRWPDSSRGRHVRIELDDGRKVLVQPGPGLMEFITALQQAQPAVAVEFGPGDRRRWERAERAGRIEQDVRAILTHRGVAIPFSIVVSAVLLGVGAEVVLGVVGAQENFQTLRSDLAKVHLPSRYHLVGTRRAGADCKAAQCSLIQTWAWAPSNGHGSSAACADVRQALATAFAAADSNSPIPANAACDYYALLGSLLHPGQGKRTVQAIVLTCQAPNTERCIITLTASYG
jgi:hypothetical protein